LIFYGSPDGLRSEGGDVEEEAYRRGLKLFREMAGPAAEQIRRRWQSLAPDFERYVLGFLAGDVWTRPVLDLRTRSLITIAALAGSGRQQGLELNIRMALNNGATRDEIVETLLHLAPYIGFPASWDALTLAAQTFGQPDVPREPPRKGSRKRRGRA
jgi:4-carboxymuconolactone decarboxylase